MYTWSNKQEIGKNTLEGTGPGIIGHVSPYWTNQCRVFLLADVMLVTLKKEPIFALTISVKVQSYLACCKPIIAALDGEGALLVRESGARLSCPAQDSDALAKAVLAIHGMPDEDRKKMGVRGRKYYELNFDRNMLINKLTGWMQELVRDAEDLKQKSLHA